MRRNTSHGAARARALMLLSATSFGLAAMLARLATGQGLTGAQVSAVRFAVGLAAVLVLFRLRPGTYRPSRWPLLAVRGFIGSAGALLYFLSLARTSAGEATLLNNLYPFFAVAVAIFTLGERPTLHLALALLLAGAGVFLVLGGGVGVGLGVELRFGLGELLGIGSALCGGVAVAAIRALRSTVNAPTIFAAFSVGGLLVSLPLAGAQPWTAEPLAWAAALATGVGSLVAQLAMTEAFGALSVPEGGLWQELTPIAAYLFGLILGERLDATTAFGVLLGIGGVLYGALLGHRPGGAGRSARPGPFDELGAGGVEGRGGKP